MPKPNANPAPTTPPPDAGPTTPIMPDGGPNLPGLMGTTPDQVDQNLGACPVPKSARLVTRHATISLPKPGSPALKLLTFHCQSDAAPGLVMTARFTLHNAGGTDATVHCVLGGSGSMRDELSLTVPGASFGAAFLQIAASASPSSAQLQGELACDVVAGDAPLSAESIKVLVRAPSAVNVVAAP